MIGQVDHAALKALNIPDQEMAVKAFNEAFDYTFQLPFRTPGHEKTLAEVSELRGRPYIARQIRTAFEI